MKMVYYCPNCGGVAPLILRKRQAKCCPDAAQDLIPEQIAMQARKGFLFEIFAFEQEQAAKTLGKLLDGAA
jgi:hypothetical protein